jgi:transcriptional regulator with XRE-family HTH domain
LVYVEKLPEDLAAAGSIEAVANRRAAAMDNHVGARIRERRSMLGMSQQQLAAAIGVTYQQAHKYERGLNRISAGRLHAIATALGVKVGFFFEGVADHGSQTAITPRQRMGLELVRNFAAIDNAKHQEALSQLVRALAPAPTGSGSQTGPGLQSGSGLQQQAK